MGNNLGENLELLRQSQNIAYGRPYVPSRPLAFLLSDPTETSNLVQTLSGIRGTVEKITVGGSNVGFGATPASSGGGSTAVSFSSLQSGTNTGKILTIGSTSLLTFSGTGVINANQIFGTTVSGTTGTGSVAFSNSPTFTGTVKGIAGGANLTMQGNSSSALGGVPGTVLDFVNGTVEVAPTTGGAAVAALSVTGDSSLVNDCFDVFTNAVTPTIGAILAVQVDTNGNTNFGGNVTCGFDLSTTNTLTCNGPIMLGDTLIDEASSSGTLGQILSVGAGDGVLWITSPYAPLANPTFTGTAHIPTLDVTSVFWTAAGAAPTSAGTAGTAGQFIYYSGLLYFCSVTGSAGSATWNKLSMTAV